MDSESHWVGSLQVPGWKYSTSLRGEVDLDLYVCMNKYFITYRFPKFASNFSRNIE